MNLRDLDLHHYRTHVLGVVPQEPVLFAGTVAENIAYGLPVAPMDDDRPEATEGTDGSAGLGRLDVLRCWLRASIDHARTVSLAPPPPPAPSTATHHRPSSIPSAHYPLVYEAARRAHALPFILSLPQQFDTCVGDKGMALSGGQKQRVALARILCRRIGDVGPRIVLLDEATSALDAASERLVRETVETLTATAPAAGPAADHASSDTRSRAPASGNAPDAPVAAPQATVLTIAHRLSTIQHADGIVVLGGGTVAETGTFAELLREEAVVAEEGKRVKDDRRGLFRQLFQQQL